MQRSPTNSLLKRTIRSVFSTTTKTTRSARQVLNDSPSVLFYSSSNRSHSTGGPKDGSHHRHHRQSHQNHRPPPNPLLTLSFLPALFSSLFNLSSNSQPNPDLHPTKYTSHKIHSIRRVGKDHVILRIELSEGSRRLFLDDSGSSASTTSITSNTSSTSPTSSTSSSPTPTRYITLSHIYLKSPSLQIERPYTPLTDPQTSPYLDLLVKRVRGGEVGRYVHSLREGDEVELRRGGVGGERRVPVGREGGWGVVDLVSTGTGIAPFIQFLHKLHNLDSGPSSSASSPSSITQINLIHYLPSNPSHSDIAEQDSSLLPSLRAIYPLLGEGGEGEARAQAGGEGEGEERRKGPRLTIKRVEGRDVVGFGVNEWTKLLLEDGRDERPAGTSSAQGNDLSKGGWWAGLFGGGDKTSSTASASELTTEGVKRQVQPDRALIMCLPRTMTDPLVGRDYPLMMRRKDVPLGGILGAMGYKKDRVWVL